MKRLDGLKVLIDGLNLELPQGTGIQSYGLALIHALKTLNVNVNVLCSKSSSKEAILNETLLLDAGGPSDSLLTQFWHMYDVLGTFLGGTRRPAKVSTGNLVLKSGAGPFFGEVAPTIGIYTLKDCFAVAHTLDKIFHRPLRIANPGSIDIWHATSPLPMTISRTKQITTIHDLIPLRLPHMTLDNKQGFYSRIRSAVQDSDHIICVSVCTKNDLEMFFDVDPTKVSVVHHPITMPDHLPQDEMISACLKRFGLKRNKYILYVGALERRKNIHGLSEAYGAIDTSMPLVMAGKVYTLRGHTVWNDEMRRVASTPNVKILEYVRRDELQCLYAGAYMFVFPSFYEGFGLPPLEAMSMGCPVITSNVSSLPEVCGEAALYVDPTSIADIRDKMITLLDDPALREKLSCRSRERAKQFSVPRFVDALYATYSTVAGRLRP